MNSVLVPIFSQVVLFSTHICPNNYGMFEKPSQLTFKGFNLLLRPGLFAHVAFFFFDVHTINSAEFFHMGTGENFLVQSLGILVFGLFQVAGGLAEYKGYCYKSIKKNVP